MVERLMIKYEGKRENALLRPGNISELENAMLLVGNKS